MGLFAILIPYPSPACHKLVGDHCLVGIDVRQRPVEVAVLAVPPI